MPSYLCVHLVPVRMGDVTQTPDDGHGAVGMVVPHLVILDALSTGFFDGPSELPRAPPSRFCCRCCGMGRVTHVCFGVHLQDLNNMELEGRHIRLSFAKTAGGRGSV